MNPNEPTAAVADAAFGWKFPITKFPITGSGGNGQLAYSDIRDPGGVPRGLPVRLKIPAIGVDSAIEDAQITNDGRMDVPAGSVNVAWFSLGPHPGQVGSAVIGGHFGINEGVPFVFYNLDKLKAGDKIYIVDDKDETLAFVVKSTASFDRNADATSVFTSQDGLAHLNLITCEGVWNQVNGNYPLRLVVFTDAIPGEGAVTVKPEAEIAATKKVALPVTAIETPEPSPSPSNLPDMILKVKVASPSSWLNPSALSQGLVSSVKMLYTKPLDGVISTLFIVSIIFITYKIFRK